MNNEKSNQGYKPTRDYDTSPYQGEKDDGLAKPNFVNQMIGEKNFRDLNLNEDLYMKNLKQKGLDKEPEREPETEDGENKREKRTYKTNYNNNKTPYNKERNSNNNYSERNNYNNSDKHHDEDGFERVGDDKKKPAFKNSQQRTPNTNYKRSNNEEDIWNDITKPLQEEGNADHRGEQAEYPKKERRDNREGNDYRGEQLEYPKKERRDNREGNDYKGEQLEYPKKERRDNRERKPYTERRDKNENVWAEEEKPVVVEQPKPVTKVEFKMKTGTNLNDLFKKKK